MVKYPSEIYGYYWKDTSKEAQTARAKHLCPFHGSKCFKQSRLIDIPFGVCTANINGEDIALCPRRFLESNIVFSDIALQEFGTIDNILVFSEIGLKGIGNFDFVMVKHKPLSSKIEDFTVIEFQTGQTTSTGKLVQGFQDYLLKGPFPEGISYGFGINSYDIWKRTFTQILNKGIIIEKWKKRIYWVVQKPIFEYFQTKYRLGRLSFSKIQSTRFALYNLKLTENRLSLIPTQINSSTVDNLFNAFRKNDDIPPVEDFIQKLQSKISTDMKIGLRLDLKKSKYTIDTPKPTSTGKIREPNIE